MTDSAWSFGHTITWPGNIAMLPTGASNPNYPSQQNAAKEFTAEERDVDALLLLAAATMAGNLEAFLDGLKPGTDAQHATYDALDMTVNLQAFLLESAQALSPEAYAGWAREQANKGPLQLFDEIRKVGR